MGLSYREYGDRDARLIVFLHGGGVSSWMWDKQVQYLTNYHCVTVDLPEQGQNAQKDKFSIKNSAHRIIELINEFANGKEVIVSVVLIVMNRFLKSGIVVRFTAMPFVLLSNTVDFHFRWTLSGGHGLNSYCTTVVSQ